MKKTVSSGKNIDEVPREEIPAGKSYEDYAGIGPLVNDIVNRWVLEHVNEDKVRPTKAWYIVEGGYRLLQLKAIEYCNRLGLRGFDADEAEVEAFERLRSKIARVWYKEDEDDAYYKDQTFGYLFFSMREYLTAKYRQLTKEKKGHEKMHFEGLLAMDEEDALEGLIELERMPKLRTAVRKCLRKMSKTNRDVWRLLLKGFKPAQVAKKLDRSVSDVMKARERSEDNFIKCLAQEGHAL